MSDKLRELIAKWRFSSAHHLDHASVHPGAMEKEHADELEAALAESGASITTVGGTTKTIASGALSGTITFKPAAKVEFDVRAGEHKLIELIFMPTAPVETPKIVHEIVERIYAAGRAAPAVGRLSEEQVRQKADEWLIGHERDFYPLTNRPALANAITKFVNTLLRSEAAKELDKKQY